MRASGGIRVSRESPVRTPGRLDLVGATILSGALVSLLLAISKGHEWGWGAPSTLWLLLGGAAALVAFVLFELRVKEPLIDVRLFKLRGVWTANLVALAVGFAMFGTFLMIPMLLELPAELGFGFGKTVTQAGLFLLPTVFAMVLLAPIAGGMVKKYGPKRPMVLGAVSIVAAFALPAIAHDQLWHIVASGLLTGAGMGLSLAACTNAVVQAVPETQTGEASSVNAIARTIGGSIGTAVISGVIAAHVSAQGIPQDAGFTNGFWIAAVVALIAIVGAIAAPAGRKRRQKADPAVILEA